MSKYGVFSGPYFSVFRLNTERYSVSLRIQAECGRIRTRKSSVFGHFSHSVNICCITASNVLLWKKDGQISGFVLGTTQFWSKIFLEKLRIVLFATAFGNIFHYIIKTIITTLKLEYHTSTSPPTASYPRVMTY